MQGFRTVDHEQTQNASVYPGSSAHFFIVHTCVFVNTIVY